MVRQLGGVQKFMAWDHPILTDSGGFQVFSLSDLRKVTEEGVAFRSHLDGSSHFFSPESAIAAQIALGADIIMAFDECTEHPAEYARTQDSMEMTLRWARRSKDYFEAHKQESAAGLPSVTGNNPDAVRHCAGRHVPRPAARIGAADGGDRLSRLRDRRPERGEPRPMTYEMVDAAIRLLPEDKPRYLMGVGTPEEIVHYVAAGVDMMDCVLPTRAARHGLLFTSEGTPDHQERALCD